MQTQNNTITGTVKAVKPETRNGYDIVNVVLAWSHFEKEQLGVFEFFGKSTEATNLVKAGDQVTIHYNLKGRRWVKPETKEAMYFTNLSGWKIETLEMQGVTESNATSVKEVVMERNKAKAETMDAGTDDLPF